MSNEKDLDGFLGPKLTAFLESCKKIEVIDDIEKLVDELNHLDRSEINKLVLFSLIINSMAVRTGRIK